jgi:hypothetical protein
MYHCSICRFATELDDVVVARAAGAGACVCLRCFGRETGSARPMPKTLQRALVAALVEGTPA